MRGFLRPYWLALSVSAQTTPAAPPGPGARLLRLDPGVHGTLLHTIDLDGSPTAVTVGEGSVWVAIEDGTVLKVDPLANEIDRRFQVGTDPEAIAYGEGSVWTANLGDDTVSRIDSTTAVVLGALTFMIATIGINIVANFVSPAFDFSNVAPQHISWRTGGMIAAVGSIFITPWNLYNNPEVIHYTLDILGSCIGPLFGILIADYYLVRKQVVKVDDLYTMSPKGAYWYQNGYNRKAIWALVDLTICT